MFSNNIQMQIYNTIVRRAVAYAFVLKTTKGKSIIKVNSMKSITGVEMVGIKMYDQFWFFAHTHKINKI